MASSRGNYPATVFLLLAGLAVSAVCSDQFDCKDVECPPEITCPPDSTIRVTYTKFDYDTRNSIDGDNTDTENDKADRSRRHTSKVMVEASDTTNDHPKSLQKRSLQYKRRESIKIVPGDYISLVPEAVRYHHQMHPHQHKWKRTADELQTKAVEVCCPKQTCVCSGNCELPKCFNPAQVPYQRAPGSNVPGKCCPLYQCIDEPDCSNLTDTTTFWQSKCKKCTCRVGQKMCHEECEEEPTCFSKNLRKSFSNGISWLEDDCTQCQCHNGEARCQVSFCKPLDCTNKMKIVGECCMVCVPNITLIINQTESTITDNATDAEFDTDVTENITTIASSTLGPAILPNVDKSTTKQVTPSPTTITSATPSPTASETQTPSTPPATAEVISTTISSSPTPKVVVSTATTASESALKNLSTRVIVSTSTIPPILAPTQRSTYFDTETESIILYTVIVILLIMCCVFAGLYIHEVTKRQTYSSIPNSDSNLSQMPRPKVEESA